MTCECGHVPMQGWISARQLLLFQVSQAKIIVLSYKCLAGFPCKASDGGLCHARIQYAWNPAWNLQRLYVCITECHEVSANVWCHATAGCAKGYGRKITLMPMALSRLSSLRLRTAKGRAGLVTRQVSSRKTRPGFRGMAYRKEGTSCWDPHTPSPAAGCS